jgi:GNAT superfamily N-acetyltransferase
VIAYLKLSGTSALTRPLARSCQTVGAPPTWRCVWKAYPMTLVTSLAPSDLRQIACVWHAALVSLPADSPLPSPAALLRRLETDLTDCHVALVREGLEVVGFAAYHLAQRWLRQLFVDPRFQGRGLGTQLLASAMRAMPQGWLRTDEANVQARRFYIHRGLRVRAIAPHPVTGVPTVEFEWP